MKKTSHYKGHRWTDEELKTLMKLWVDDIPITNISDHLNVSQVGLLKQIQRMRSNGIPLPRRKAGNPIGNAVRPWTQGDVEYLVRRRNEKATSEEIAAQLGRSPNAVDAMIQKLRKEDVGIAMRGNGVRRLWDANSLKSLLLNPIFK